MELPATPYLSLAKREILRLRDAAGWEIHVKDGCLWITEEGETADHVVCGGSTFRIRRPGLTVASALQSTRIAITGDAQIAPAALRSAA